MAAEVFHSTSGKENFQRMVRLLISGGTTLLREIYDKRCPPSDLPRILKNPATLKKLAAARLTKPQWDSLYPSPGTYGKSEDFDVTLLFKLLRTTCSLIPPSTGWDDLPANTDHSLGADLARIKYYRNSVYGHVDQHMEIPDDEFPSLWQEISNALLRIADQINTKKKDEWQKAIDKFLTEPLTAQHERNVQELKCWYTNDTDLKEYVENLNSSIKEVQNVVEKEGQHLETAAQDISHEVKCLRSEFREKARDIKDQLGEVHQSIDRLGSSAGGTQAAGVQVRVLIDCETILGSCPQVGASGSMALASQGSQTGGQEMVAPRVKHKAEKLIASSQPQYGVALGGSEGANVETVVVPSTQDLLNMIADRYFKRRDKSNEEMLNGFIEYMQSVRNVLFVNAQTGSLIITVECGSLEILDGLWDDYCTGHLNEMAQTYLVTEDILKEFGLVEVKLSTTIQEEEYRAAREYFMQGSGLGFSESYQAKTTMTYQPYSAEHVDVAHNHINLGNVQHDLGDLQQAKEHYERAVDIQLKTLGPKHIDVAHTYNNLGNVQRALGDLRQSKEHYERALDIQLKKLGPEHVDVARTLTNLGNVRRTLGDLQQAKSHHERALGIRLAKLGPENVDVAGTYNNLGNVERDLGDLQQAKQHYERALDIRLKKLGRDHVNVAGTCNNLGNVQYALGNLQHAKLHYKRALHIQLKKLGKEHVDVARTYNNLGNVRYALDDLRRAKEHYERALDIQLKTLGPEHVDVACTYDNLGNVQRDLGDLQRANEDFVYALHIRQGKLGPEHVDVASTYHNLGNVQHDLGDLQQAKKHYERALDIRLAKIGPEHVDVARTCNNLGNVERDLGNLQQANTFYKRALDIKQKKLGLDHVDVARACNNLGNIERDLGNPQQANKCYKLALDIEQKRLGPGDDAVKRIQDILSDVQPDLGDQQQANECFERTPLDIRMKTRSLQDVIASIHRNYRRCVFGVNCCRIFS